MGIKRGQLNITAIKAGQTNISKVYRGTNVIYEDTPFIYTGLCFTANTANSTVELLVNSSDVTSYYIENTAYSTNGVTWTSFTPSTTSGVNTITLAAIGDKVYFRNTILTDFDTSHYMHFVMTGSIAASGDCNSMYHATDYASLTRLLYRYCYYKLFENCTSLTTAPELPTSGWILNGCYSNMFSGCANLVVPPILPSTTLSDSCYSNMFRNCTSLISAPALPAIDIYLWPGCYYYMFYNCTALTTPPALPSNDVGSACYSGMFCGCTSLIASSSSGTGYTTAWNIPTSGTFTNTKSYTMSDMFRDCAMAGSGGRDLYATTGTSTVRYTQNTPIQ